MHHALCLGNGVELHESESFALSVLVLDHANIAQLLQRERAQEASKLGGMEYTYYAHDYEPICLMGFEL
mgnify:CR=1 FL=1